MRRLIEQLDSTSGIQDNLSPNSRINTTSNEEQVTPE